MYSVSRVMRSIKWVPLKDNTFQYQETPILTTTSNPAITYNALYAYLDDLNALDSVSMHQEYRA